jgi:dTDP-4-amino-4,6-dideoxygalactose transaminase
VAGRHGLFLVADAACSAGGTYAGRSCGAFGDVAVFSLHARKGITCGEGGVLVTDDAELAGRVRAGSCFGMESAYARQSANALAVPTFPTIGYNYKLSDVLAAIAVVQLSRLDELMKARRLRAARYAELFADVAGVQLPAVPDDREPTWQTFAVLVDDRDAVIRGLRRAGIGSNIGTYAMHMQPVYRATQDCPVSRHLFEHHVALPMAPDLSEDDQLRVVAEIRDLTSR